MNYLEKNKDIIFKKYCHYDLIKDLNNFKYGKGRLSKTLSHYFEEIIFKAKGPRGKISPFEALQDNDLMKKILDYIKTKPKFYNDNEITNVKSFFRNGGKYAQKVANFCPKTARDIYNKLGKPNKSGYNILDTSCGFGSRMCATLLSNNNYYGIEPWTELIQQLIKLSQFIKTCDISKNTCKLYNTGSEIFIPQLENKIDISFTSPPYYDLEIYSNENSQSSNYKTYDKWLEYFVIPTINNIYRYLKINGIAAINIKNSTYGKKYKLFDDWFDIFKQVGFKHKETFEMKHQAKKNYTMNCNYSKEKYTGFKEPVMVFSK